MNSSGYLKLIDYSLFELSFDKVAMKSANAVYKNFTGTVSWVWGYFSGSNNKGSGGLTADLSDVTGMPDHDY